MPADWRVNVVEVLGVGDQPRVELEPGAEQLGIDEPRDEPLLALVDHRVERQQLAGAEQIRLA